MRDFLSVKQIYSCKYRYYHLASFIILVCGFGGMLVAWGLAEGKPILSAMSFVMMILVWWPDKSLIQAMDE